MKTKNFQEYLEGRLSKDELAEIEEQARREIRILKSIQKTISLAMANYMERKKIGFNELVKRLNSSPFQMAKVQKGEANLTLASLAHLLALLEQDPQDIFKNRR